MANAELQIEDVPIEYKEHVVLIQSSLHRIITELVDDPSVIKYRLVVVNTRLIIEIFAYKQTGFIMGKEGKTATHIKGLIDSIASKYRRKNNSPIVNVDLEIRNTINES